MNTAVQGESLAGIISMEIVSFDWIDLSVALIFLE